jgi:hypothetical protein
LDESTPPEDYFNPYNNFVHGTIRSNAYAFSIDDKAAFLSVPAQGLIIAIGGSTGLAYPNEQFPLPSLKNLNDSCPYKKH